MRIVPELLLGLLMSLNATCAKDGTRATTHSQRGDEEQGKSKCGAFEPELPRFFCGTGALAGSHGIFPLPGLSTCYHGRFRHTGSRWGCRAGGAGFSLSCVSSLQSLLSL
jgi:hypothetical protein